MDTARPTVKEGQCRRDGGGRGEGRAWLWRGRRKSRVWPSGIRPSATAPTRQRDLLLLLLLLRGIKAGVWGKITPLGQESVHSQPTYVCYPQSGLSDCETDLRFISTLRPGFAMSASTVNCVLRAVCFSGGGGAGRGSVLLIAF